MKIDKPKPHLYDMADRIRRLREQKGLKQRDLAKAAGMNQPAIFHAEAATRELKATSLGKIANALGVSTDYLLNG